MPKLFKDAGNTNSPLKPEQPLNACSPMVSNVFGKTTEERLEHSAKAKLPMIFNESGMLMEAKE